MIAVRSEYSATWRRREALNAIRSRMTSEQRDAWAVATARRMREGAIKADAEDRALEDIFFEEVDAAQSFALEVLTSKQRDAFAKMERELIAEGEPQLTAMFLALGEIAPHAAEDAPWLVIVRVLTGRVWQ
jgi:hypothetical protein